LKISCLLKNKNLFYAVFILFYGFYSNAYAADNVRTLRDKCRASYNNFMQALKENPDQESINQLAAKYKSDYATYQKALKSSSALSNKNNTSIKSSSNASYQSNDEPAAAIKQDTPKDIPRKPMRITNESLKSPQKISEPLAAKIDGFTPTPLPSNEELINGDTSGEKLYYIEEIKKMSNEVINNEYCYLDGKMKSILLSASKFPDLCALAILYNVEGEIKKMMKPDYLNVSPDVAVSLLEHALTLQNMLAETVDTYSQGSKATYKVCQNVVDAISKPGGRLDMLKQCISKQKDVMALNIKNAISLIDKNKKELVDFQTNIYNANNRPTSVQINERCNGIITAYSTIIRSNLALGNYEEAKKYRDKLDDFYKNKLSGPYVIRYKQSSDQTITEKIYITKTPDQYVYAKFEYFDTLFKDKNESLDYELLKSELKEFSDYSEGIPHTGEYDISIPWYKTMAPDLLNNISQPYTISNFRIANSGKAISSSNNEIYDSESTFTLKFRASRYITEKAIEAILESSVSKRLLTLKFKRSNLFDTSNYCDYYATFIPSAPDAKTSLIKKHGNGKDELKHTVCTSDANPMFFNNPFYDILNSDFFKDRVLGKGIIYPPNSNDEIKINTHFFENMGFENIVVKFNKTETSLKISNQADWFIAQGHSTPSAPEYQISLLKGETLIPHVTYWIPKFLKNFNNKNLDFLIFGVCHLLQEPSKTNDINGTGMNAIEWQNLLGNKVAIIGYSFLVYSDVCNKSMKYLINGLNDLSLSYPYTESDKEKVINKWLEIHCNIYNNSVKKLQQSLIEALDGPFSHTAVSKYNELYEEHDTSNKYSRWASAIYQNDSNKNMFYKLKIHDEEPIDVNLNFKINYPKVDNRLLEICSQEVKY